MTETKDLNALLQAVCNIEPLTEYEEPIPEPDQEMKFGLAQVYANKGYRKYMENVINKSIKNAALFADDALQGAAMKGRVITLKELLIKSKRAFEDFEAKAKKLKLGKVV